jgi:hypothetical protein
MSEREVWLCKCWDVRACGVAVQTVKLNSSGLHSLGKEYVVSSTRIVVLKTLQFSAFVRAEKSVSGIIIIIIIIIISSISVLNEGVNK